MAKRTVATLSLILLALAGGRFVAGATSFLDKCSGKRIQVFSDVDDTLKCPSRLTRANGYGGGVDTAWTNCNGAHSIIYPGMPALLVELSRGEGRPSDQAPEGVRLLSARPQEAVDWGLLQVNNDSPAAVELRAAGGPGLKPTHYGSVKDNLYVHREDRFKAYAQEKLKDMRDQLVADQEEDEDNWCYIFVGDNGQGDALAATWMLEDKDLPLQVTLIHDVTATPKLSVDVDHERFRYFSSAPAAAEIAMLDGIISSAGAARVAAAARASDEYGYCGTTCKPFHLLGKCMDVRSSCQADKTGKPPGCPQLLADLASLDSVIGTFEASGRDAAAAESKAYAARQAPPSGSATYASASDAGGNSSSIATAWPSLILATLVGSAVLSRTMCSGAGSV